MYYINLTAAWTGKQAVPGYFLSRVNTVLGVLRMNRSSDLEDTSPATRTPTLLRQYLAVLSVAGACFAIITTEYLPVGLIPAMSPDLDISSGTAGLTMTVPAIVATLSALGVSVIFGRFDRRTVLLGLIGLLCVSNLISFLAPNFETLLVGRLLVGIALGGFWPLGISIGARLMPEPTGARGVTIILSGLSIGTIAGVPAGTLIAEHFGWRGAFGAASAISALSCAALFVFLPSTMPLRLARWRDLGLLLYIPQARLGLLLALLTFGGTFFAYPYIGPFLQIVAKMHPQQISGMLVLFGVCGLFGNALGGWLVTRSHRLAMIINAIALALPVFLLARFGSSGIVTVLMMGVWGCAYGGLSIVCQAWMAREAPDVLETGGALYVAVAQISVSLGAWFGGMIVDELGVQHVMAVSGFIALFAASLVFFFGRPSRGQSKPSS
jgi:predicted MFS family arabinose efflux permease